MSFFIGEEQFLALILVILTFWMQLSWFPTARLYCDPYHITICWEIVSIYSVARKNIGLYSNTRKYFLTNFYPLSWFKITMVTLWVQWIRMILMFVANMTQERIPLCSNQWFKTSCGWRCAPVNMSPNAFHPVLNNPTPFLLTQNQEFLGHGSGYVPNVKVILSSCTVLANPLRNSSMTIGYKYTNWQAECFQIGKAPFCPLQLCLLATSCFISLEMENRKILVCYQLHTC